jgi:hypothetical protein
MYDSSKIIAGLVIFVILVSFPLWYNHGKATPAPKPVLPVTEKVCVESTDYMTTSHMQLLDTWRDKVVRTGDRVYTNSEGKSFTISLTGTCLGCHTSKAEFCDSCHNYASVKPYCWECHLTEKGNQ